MDWHRKNALLIPDDGLPSQETSERLISKWLRLTLTSAHNHAMRRISKPSLRCGFATSDGEH